MRSSLSCLGLAALVALLSGCISPRTAGLGITAAPVGAGMHEASVSLGGAYSSELSPPSQAPSVAGNGTGAMTTYPRSRGLALPMVEANAQLGVSKWLGFNLHASPGGLTPGLKLTVLRKPLALAFLPELGLGYGSVSNATIVFDKGVRTDTPPVVSKNLNLLAGIRILLSHASGFYTGLGYQLQWLSSTAQGGSGSSAVSQTSRTTFHNLLAAAGYEYRTGALAVRGELAFLYNPGSSVALIQNGKLSATQSGGNGFYLFPNVTFALGGAVAEETEEEEQESGNRSNEDRLGDHGSDEDEQIPLERD